jgi:hypothetical protein
MPDTRGNRYGDNGTIPLGGSTPAKRRRRRIPMIAIIIFIVIATVYLFVTYSHDVVINHHEAYKAYLEAAMAAYNNDNVAWIYVSINNDGENIYNKPYGYYTGNSDDDSVHMHLERVAKCAIWCNTKARKGLYHVVYSIGRSNWVWKHHNPARSIKWENHGSIGVKNANLA